MQGHRTTIGSFSDFFNLEHGSSSSNVAINWSNVSDNRDSENFLAPSNSIDFMNNHLFDGRGYDLSNDNEFSVGQSSRSVSSPVNLEIDSGFVGHGSEDSPLVECPDSFKPSVEDDQLHQSTNSSEPEPFTGLSESGVNLGGESEDGTRSSLEGRHVPCKRKSFEGQVGQSSRDPGYNQDAESSHCPDASLGYNSPINGSLAISEQAAPRVRLGARATSPLSSERLPRNVRSRLNTSGQHSSDPLINSELVGSDLGLLLCQESSSGGMNSQAHTPELHIPAFPLGGPEQASAAGAESSGEATTSGLRNTLEDHPMFIPSSESRVHGQSRSSSGGIIRIPRNLIPPSQTGDSSSIHPPVSRRPMHYPRRLSEYVRRSLSAVGSEPGGGSSNYPLMASGHSGSSQDMVLSPRRGNANNHARHSLPSRSSYWLDRQGDEGVLGLPYSVRAFATAGEGRRRLASEVCVCDFP